MGFFSFWAQLCRTNKFYVSTPVYTALSQFSDNCDIAGFRLVFVRYSAICTHKNAVVNGSQTTN